MLNLVTVKDLMLVSVSLADVVRIGFEACRCGGDGRNAVDVMVGSTKET